MGSWLPAGAGMPSPATAAGESPAGRPSLLHRRGGGTSHLAASPCSQQGGPAAAVEEYLEVSSLELQAAAVQLPACHRAGLLAAGPETRPAATTAPGCLSVHCIAKRLLGLVRTNQQACQLAVPSQRHLHRPAPVPPVPPRHRSRGRHDQRTSCQRHNACCCCAAHTAAAPRQLLPMRRKDAAVWELRW